MTSKKIMKVVLLVAAIASTACSYKPMPEAQSVMDNALSSSRAVQGDGFVIFKPQEQTSKQGCFVFYPGGLVSNVVYAPMMQGISDAGYNAYLLKMPFDLAVMAMDAADKVKTSEAGSEYCSHYVISGHSLGGVAAANYALENPQDDILLLAAYPQESKPIVEHLGRVVSIFSSNDGLTSLDDIEASRLTLPKSTKFVKIEGGNHAQFGWYGAQKDDGEAQISREAQQAIVLETALELLSTPDL